MGEYLIRAGIHLNLLVVTHIIIDILIPALVSLGIVCSLPILGRILVRSRRPQGLCTLEIMYRVDVPTLPAGLIIVYLETSRTVIKSRLAEVFIIKVFGKRQFSAGGNISNPCTGALRDGFICLLLILKLLHIKRCLRCQQIRRQGNRGGRRRVRLQHVTGRIRRAQHLHLRLKPAVSARCSASLRRYLHLDIPVYIICSSIRIHRQRDSQLLGITLHIRTAQRIQIIIRNPKAV